MKNILVIDNYDSFVYNLVQLLKENGKCRFDIVRNDRIDFTRLSRYDGLLLSPGPGIPAEAGDLLRVVNQCKTTHSILGICLGHQAIAESFGAKLERLPFPKHGHESPLIIQDTEDPIYRNLPSQAVIGRYHSWTVTPSTLLLLKSALSMKRDISCPFITRSSPFMVCNFIPNPSLPTSALSLLTIG